MTKHAQSEKHHADEPRFPFSLSTLQALCQRHLARPV